MDGMQVIRLLKDGKPETGVIVITGYETVPSVVEAMKAGVADYLIKPFTEDTFIKGERKASRFARCVKPFRFKNIFEEGG